MNVEDEWILFLETNPEFYELSKGDFFIKFLERLSKNVKSFSELRGFFPKIEAKDLKLILDSLVKLKAISTSKMKGQIFYTVTSKGKNLLRLYRKTEKFFKA